MTNDDETYQIKLYRLSDEVTEEIFKAISFYGKHSITKNPLLLERAARDISNVYSIVNKSQDVFESTSETGTNENAKAMAAVNLQNTLTAFDMFLDKMVVNVSEDEVKSKVVNSVKKSYKALVLDTLLNL